MRILCRYKYNDSPAYDYYMCYEDGVYYIFLMAYIKHILCEKADFINNNLIMNRIPKYLSSDEYDIASQFTVIFIDDEDNETTLIISQIKQNERLMKINKLWR